jgi:hypothetical protein
LGHGIFRYTKVENMGRAISAYWKGRSGRQYREATGVAKPVAKRPKLGEKAAYWEHPDDIAVYLTPPLQSLAPRFCPLIEGPKNCDFPFNSDQAANIINRPDWWSMNLAGETHGPLPFSRLASIRQTTGQFRRTR